MERKRVAVVPYDAAWEESFRAIAAGVREALGDLALRIEHVGSTAVPGLCAKPIIDIDAVIRDASLTNAAAAALGTIGYTWEGDLGIPGREAFRYDGRDGLQKRHLYVCAEDSAELKRHLSFRDFLRSCPEAARAYGRIKEEGAALFPHDMDAYIRHKAGFIEAVYRKLGV